MVRHSVKHTLEPDALHQLIERAFAYYESRHPKYEPTLSWLEPNKAELRFNARGLKLGARLEIQPGEAIVEMDVPLLLRPFQGAARQVIDREITRWLTNPPDAPTPDQTT